MSLATRCSRCGTTFRVVQDQLKVSEGWVRCGRCQNVFHAVEELFDLERDAPELQRKAAAPAPDAAPGDGPSAATPPKAPPVVLAVAAPPPAAPVATVAPVEPAPVVAPPVPAVPPAAVPAATAADAAPAPSPVDAGAELDGTGTPATEPLDAPDSDPPLLLPRPGPKPAGAVGARDRLEFSDARFDSDLFEDDARPDGEPPELAAPTGAMPLESEMGGEFLRRPDRRPGWRPAPARGVAGALAALAAVALVAQVAVHHRSAIAAAWPWTHGPLDLACAAAGCTVDAPRRIEALTVESTALARAVGQDGFVLTVALRNRGATALVTPSVDLTLTDGAGRLVARRALAPAEMRAAATVAAGADLQMQTALDVRGVRIAGYTVEIFYP